MPSKMFRGRGKTAPLSFVIKSSLSSDQRTGEPLKSYDTIYGGACYQEKLKITGMSL